MECKYEDKDGKCIVKCVVRKNKISDYCSFHNKVVYRKNYYKTYYKERYNYNSLDYYKKLSNEQIINKIEQLQNKIKVLQELST